MDGQQNKQGQRAHNDQQDQPAGGRYLTGRGSVDQIAYAVDQLRHHVADIPPIGHEHRHQRAQMQQHIEELRYLGIQAQQVLGDRQVSGTGNGQKLRQALYQSQQERRKVCHCVTSYRIWILFVIFFEVYTVCYHFMGSRTGILYHTYAGNATLICHSLISRKAHE